METPEKEKKTNKLQQKNNTQLGESQLGHSEQIVSLMPPPFNPTSNGIIQRRIEGDKPENDRYEGNWQMDHIHGGQKIMPADPNKPKQKWIQDPDGGGWKQIDKVPGEKESLAPIKLPDRYKDEDKKAGWRAGERQDLVDTTKIVTKYFNEEEQEKNNLSNDGEGYLQDSDGNDANFPSGKLYAMSKTGEIGAHKEEYLPPNAEVPGNEQQSIHHSSIYAGDDVMHAGHISTKDGKVSALDDDSGHYKPDQKHTYAAYKKMKKAGILHPDGKIKLVNKEGDKMDQLAWYDNMVNLPFAAYDQTKGNEKQIRNKKNVISELNEEHSVQEEEGQNLVPVPFKPNYAQVSGKSATYGTAQEPNQNLDHEEYSYEDEDSYSEEGNVMVYNPLTGGFDGNDEEGIGSEESISPYLHEYNTYPYAAAEDDYVSYDDEW